MFIFIACVPFVYSDAARAIASVPDRYVETAQTLGASRLQIVSKVLVALALPDIYNSLRHLFGMAFGYIMLAELINAKHGFGYLLMTSQRRGLSEHIILILIDHRFAGLRDRSHVVLVPARVVPTSPGRGLTVRRSSLPRRRISSGDEALWRRHRHSRRHVCCRG